MGAPTVDCRLGLQTETVDCRLGLQTETVDRRPATVA
jgi:hypothetical protein